jgi:uncharacterized OB-fold protein
MSRPGGCPHEAITVKVGRRTIDWLCEQHFASRFGATCDVCGEVFVPPYGPRRRRFCSDECRRAHDRQRKAWTPVVHVEQSCAQCGELFVPARSDARYCSGRCRVAAHRASA